MKKLLTITAILLLTLLMMIVAAGFYLNNLVDPNKFKGRISQYVYTKTGQVLIINGSVRWSLFPWVGFKADNLVYYNAPNFYPKIFIAAKEMDIKIKLIPLMTRKIEIDDITLDKTVLNLIKNKNGQYNWQTLTASHTAQPQTIANTNGHSNNTPLTKIFVSSLKIKNAKLHWIDQQNNSHTTISALNISGRKIQSGQPFALTMDFTLLDNTNKKDLSLELQSNMTISSDYQRYDLKDLQMNGIYFIGKNKINFQSKGWLTTHLRQHSLATSQDFEFDNAQGHLSLASSNKNDNSNLSGNIFIKKFNLKKLLEDIGNPLMTNNEDALTSILLSSKITVNNSQFQLQQLHAVVDNTNILGNFVVTPRDKYASFNLTANRINITDYMLKKNIDIPATPVARPASPVKVTATTAAPPQSQWRFNGDIKLANLIADKMRLSDIATKLYWNNHITRLSALHATLYHGDLQGTVTVDSRQPNKTIIYFNPTLAHLDIKELLSELFGAQKLTGVVDLSGNLISIADNTTTFPSGLNGNLHLNFVNGSIRGIDVIYQLSRAHAFIKHLSRPATTDSKETKFNSLTANAMISNGVINSNDLALSSEYLKVNGRGTTNLFNKEIRYHLNGLAQPRLAQENTNIGHEVTVYQIPIKVTGKLTKPNVNLDFAELAKIIYTKKIQNHINNVIQKNIKIKDDLKEKMQNKLKDASTSILKKLSHATHFGHSG